MTPSADAPLYTANPSLPDDMSDRALPHEHPPNLHHLLSSTTDPGTLHQLAVITRALDATPPPTYDERNDAPDSVPTSIDMVGPGNYGNKEIDDGNEVVMLNDDVLTSVANATVVIIDGNDLERITVLYQFPQFLEHCPDDCINIMVPRICSEAVTWSPECQMAAAEALYFVVNRKAPPHVAKQIAWAALAIASATTSAEVFDACGEIVSIILPQVHRYDVLQFVVPDAVERTASDRPPERRLAARVIGSLNDALSSDELEQIFLNSIIALARDPDDTVRAMMAQSMAAVATKLSLRVAEEKLWPRLKDLMSDENVQVRAAAMRAMAKSAESHRSSAEKSRTYVTLIKPLFLQECQKATQVAASDLRTVTDDTYLTLEIFSEVYGYFLCAVSTLLNEEQSWTLVLNTLRQMVTCNGPTVRHWCAFNIPAVAVVIASARSEHLLGVIPALAADSDIETRATLAAGVHEVAKALRSGPLRNDVIRAIGMLFMDNNAQVRMSALGHFSELLVLLSPGEEVNLEIVRAQLRANDSGVKKVDVNAKELTPEEEEMRRLAPIFSSLEMMSFDSWRTQKLLAEELQNSAHLIPQEMLCEHVAPLLFQMARESTFLVRKASMHSLIYVLRYIPDVRRRNHILKHFKTEWARGKVYWTRLAYIEAAECAYHMFSRKLFTQLFKDELLIIQKDKVVNVRLRLLRFLFLLAPIWKDLPEYVQVIRELSSDEDMQVSQDAKGILATLPQVVSPSFEDVEKDKSLEAEENAFFVHRSNKKKKNRGKSGTILDNRAQNGVKAKTMDTTSPKHVDNSAGEERVIVKPQPNTKNTIVPPTENLDSSGRRPSSKLSTNSQGISASKSPDTIPSSAKAKVTKTQDSVTHDRQKQTDMGKDANDVKSVAKSQEQEDDRDQTKTTGFFKKLFSSCLGGG